METKRTIDIRLTDTLHAKLVIERDGQQKPCDSDDVRVRASVCLPIDGSMLPNALHFGARVDVANMPLIWDWGVVVDGWRVATHTVSGASYPVLMDEAETWAREAIQPLLDALAVRAAVLRNAG